MRKYNDTAERITGRKRERKKGSRKMNITRLFYEGEISEKSFI